jgi:hypothetical protein
LAKVAKEEYKVAMAEYEAKREEAGSASEAGESSPKAKKPK